MRLVSFALLTALLAFGQPALAEQAIVTGVVIDWFGNYTSVEKAVEDSDISTGKRYRGSNIVPPKTNSDEIKPNSKTTFGFGFTLTGSPPKADVTLRQVYKYPSPGMPIGTTGQFKPSDEVTSALQIRWREHGRLQHRLQHIRLAHRHLDDPAMVRQQAAGRKELHRFAAMKRPARTGIHLA